MRHNPHDPTAVPVPGPTSSPGGEDTGEGDNLIPLILTFSRNGRRNHTEATAITCGSRTTHDSTYRDLIWTRVSVDMKECGKAHAKISRKAITRFLEAAMRMNHHEATL